MLEFEGQIKMKRCVLMVKDSAAGLSRSGGTVNVKVSESDFVSLYDEQ